MENGQHCGCDVHVKVAVFAEGEVGRSNAGVPLGAVGAVDSWVFAFHSTDALAAVRLGGLAISTDFAGVDDVAVRKLDQQVTIGANESGIDGNWVVHQLLGAPGLISAVLGRFLLHSKLLLLPQLFSLQ